MSEFMAKVILAVILGAAAGAAIALAWPAAPEPEIGTPRADSGPAPAEVSQLIEEAKRITREASE